MLEGSDESPKIDIAHVLTIGMAGSSTLTTEEQTKWLNELRDFVNGSTRFRVADAAGKVVSRSAESEISLVFFDDPHAAMECAEEIAVGLKTHPEMKWRIGIHSGSVTRSADFPEKEMVSGENIDVSRLLMQCGDAGHILLSKRIAYDLASSPRWTAQLYELGDCEIGPGQNVSMVNFYTDQLGNPELPLKIKRARREIEARDRRARWLRRVAIAAVVITVLSTIALATFWIRREVSEIAAAAAPEKSVAVMPFVDLSPARDSEYFCDGISEEILGELADVPGLRVVARESSFSFKSKTPEINEIGHKLDAATVLQGDLRRDGNSIRVDARLIDTRTGSALWSGRVEKEIPDVFALQDQIAKAVVRALRIRSSLVPGGRVPPNDAAYDLYLQGLFLSNKGDEINLRKSLELFQRALDEDPKLGRAWTGIAKSWFALANSFVKPLDAYPRAKAAAEKAVALDARDAEARCYLGEAKRILDWDLPGDESELKRALEIQPSSVNGHLFLGRLLGYVGDAQNYVIQLQTAARLDLLSPATSYALVSAYVETDHLDDALAEAKRTIEIDSNYAYFESALALVYREQGKLKEALEIYQRLEQTRKQPAASLGITYALLGRKEDAKRVVDQLVQRANTYYFPGDQIAAIYVALGENDEAFRWLDRAIEEHSAPIHRIAFAREFRPLQSDPRFPELLRRIGLDPAKLQKSNGPHSSPSK